VPHVLELLRTQRHGAFLILRHPLGEELHSLLGPAC
jgi:hypothetical protein